MQCGHYTKSDAPIKVGRVVRWRRGRAQLKVLDEPGVKVVSGPQGSH